eukprot:UN24111
MKRVYSARRCFTTLGYHPPVFTTTHLKEYQKDGFTVVRGMFNEAEMDLAREAFKKDPDFQIIKTEYCWGMRMGERPRYICGVILQVLLDL